MICVLKQVKRFRGPSVPFWVSVSLFGVLELGDPNARVIEVFLLVSQSVSRLRSVATAAGRTFGGAVG